MIKRYTENRGGMAKNIYGKRQAGRVYPALAGGLLFAFCGFFAIYFITSSLSRFLAPLYGAEVLQEVVVKPGDTLWGVANYYLKDPKRWPDILKHNPQLSSDPNVILPGMRIKVPILLIKEHLRSARLVYILEDVRYRRKKEAEWKKAWLNMELYEEDGVRTLEKSQANVKLPSGELLRLYENSLLIVRPEKLRDEAELVAGQVRASRAKIVAAETLVTPQITHLTEAPDFKTKIKADKTTLVEVYKGVIDVTSQGKTVTVKEGFGTEVKFMMAPTAPIRLPDMPDFSSELKDIKTVAVKGGKFELSVAAPEAGIGPRKSEESETPPIEKKTEKPAARIIGSAVKKYRVQISTSSTFTTVLYDEVNDLKGKVSVDFKDARLGDGLYFWRVSYLDEFGFEGKFSEPRTFVVDTTPPKLNLTSPRDGAEYDTDFIYVEGVTEPGIALTVNGEAATIESNGNFLYAILVKGKEGAVRIKIEAVDAAGNSTLIERTVFKVKRVTKKEKSDSAGGRDKSSFPAGLIALAVAVVAGIVLLLVKP